MRSPNNPAAMLVQDGASVACARKTCGLTQGQLAARATISVSLLRKIEQGTRTLTPGVRAVLAEVLVPAAAECGSDRVWRAIPLLREVMDCYDIPAETGPRALPGLRADVARATQLRLASRYAELAVVLPAVITDITVVALTTAGPQQREAFGLLAMAYRAADAIADKYSCHDLSARAIELIRWAATSSGDPVLEKVAAYVRAELFFTGTHQASTGLRFLDKQTPAMPARTSARALAAHGSLQMRAAVLAARAGRPEEAQDRLAEACAAARFLPDGIYDGTAFGPSSVRVHQIAAAAEAGLAGQVLQLAEGWEPPQTLPAERRSHFYIELARACRWAGQPEQALQALMQARQTAPQHTRHSLLVRETVEGLVRRSRRPNPPLRQYAAWVAAATPASSG